MPMPQPREGEKLNQFIERFMRSSAMRAEFSEHQQRLAVAYRTWRESGRSAPTPQATLSRYTKVTRQQGAYE